VPEKKYAVRIAANKTRAINHIGKTIKDGLKEPVEFPRVIF
jgi:hypothetical protein